MRENSEASRTGIYNPVNKIRTGINTRRMNDIGTRPGHSTRSHLNAFHKRVPVSMKINSDNSNKILKLTQP
jgi:hypothetical protein